jgi:hypothetical protein
MRSYLKKASLIAALALTPALLAAEPPTLGTFLGQTTSYVLGAGQTSFDIQYLFARAANNNTVYYNVYNTDGSIGSWVAAFAVAGATPTVISPDPTGGVPVTVSVAAALTNRRVEFGLCQGFFVTFTSCTSPLNGPFVTGPGATNAIGLSVADWNANRAGLGVTPNANIISIAAFEDTKIPQSDSDFSDMIIGTSLSRTIPEPSTYVLMFSGLALVGLAARRRRA